MGSITPPAWFDDRPLVNQFPWLYRQYARYCRLIANRSSGQVRGGTALFSLIGNIHTVLGAERGLGLDYADSKVFLDVTDNRIFEVLDEIVKDSGERRILSSLLNPGDTFVDIGANHGSYSLVATKLVGPTGLVLAFEPQSRLAELVERSLKQTDASDFEVLQAGCSDHSGSVEFYVPKHASGSAGLFKAFSAAGQHSKTTIKLTTIDACIVKLLVRGSLFFKLDVEGSEYTALVGARQTIERHRPPILFEINPSSALASGHSVEDLLHLFSNMGYRSFCEIDEFPLRKSIDAVDTKQQRNLLALHCSPTA